MERLTDIISMIFTTISVISTAVTAVLAKITNNYKKEEQNSMVKLNKLIELLKQAGATDQEAHECAVKCGARQDATLVVDGIARSCYYNADDQGEDGVYVHLN